ncbi:hypothetical protein HanRHA438_Chr04g0193111 [Helianthus annuus]|nr:hypothetical protein HanRHA438_Chr04g0193111 [Helianthus annuus]
MPPSFSFFTLSTTAFKSLSNTFTFSPYFMNNVNDIFCSTLCPGTTARRWRSSTAAAIDFICKYARSLPRQILGPALNATNLYESCLTNFVPSGDNHLSGRYSRQSSPHVDFIRPAEYIE